MEIKKLQTKTFISDSFIIPVYDIEKRGVNKLKTLIMNTQYIQKIKQIHESKQKGKYFLIITEIG